ncbi:MAG: very short patch repair endonuclease [Roseococcus sp.]
MKPSEQSDLSSERCSDSLPRWQVTSDQRSRLMSRIRSANTVPELAVRKLCHSWGYRYRLHRRDLPGSPDLVFPRLRKIVFVHGCFWHRHSDPCCRNSVLPKTRREWWEAKLSANVRRDARNEAALTALGWEVLVIWECEIRNARHRERLEQFLQQQGTPPGSDQAASPSWS